MGGCLRVLFAEVCVFVCPVLGFFLSLEGEENPITVPPFRAYPAGDARVHSFVR